MKCNVCGTESGKYPLCKACNIKKERGEIIKCEKCGKWHYKDALCPLPSITDDSVYLYNLKSKLITKSEQEFYTAIKAAIPENYCVFPQINLAAFIERTDNSRFHNELFRNVDFLITDSEYTPKLVIEINDQTHLSSERKERDEKVCNICEEAGIPIIKLWTSYGVKQEYIKERIGEALAKLPITRIHHFDSSVPQSSNATTKITPKKQGCYVATCVYGSYNCPEVWVLRRYRDRVLSSSYFGSLFVKFYYAISPTLVKWFGKNSMFLKTGKFLLDKIVTKLQNNGFENTPYNDK